MSAMWVKAMTQVVKPRKEVWRTYGVFTRWLIVTRASVLQITWLTAFVTGLYAYRDGMFNLNRFLLYTFGIVLAHATNNMLNDVIDWVKGVDQGNYFRIQYGAHLMELMTKKQVAQYVITTGLAALGIAVYLCATGDALTLYCALSGAFFLLFYTYPLKYIGLGEVSVFIVWGVLMVAGGYHTITGVWSWQVVYDAAPLSLGITVIIFGKHIDKLNADQEKGILTLPVLLGDKLARYVAIAIIWFQYAIVFFRWGISPHLLVLFALPKFVNTVNVYLDPAPKMPPPTFPKDVWPLWFVGFAFRHTARFGSLFLIGSIIAAITAR